MRVAFPYMGNIRFAVGAIMRTLGAEVVVPGPPNRTVLEVGARLSPELMCIPFKLTLGNMVRALDMGADTLVYAGGSWSCRFGYFGRLQAMILRRLGYRFRVLEVRRDQLPVVFREALGLADGRLSRALLRGGRALRLAWYKSRAVDAAEALAREAAPFAAEPGEPYRMLNRVLALVDKTETPAGLKQVHRDLRQTFGRIPRNGRTWVPRVKLVGESFCVVEPFVNFNVIRKLGEMGVFADPFLTAHRWVGFHGLRLWRDELKNVRRASASYWRYCVGGEDQNSLGHLILAARKGYDGVVHVHPFGCMPSAVAQPTMAKACRDFDIPLLSLSLDEHSSETGVMTRLEAFVSLLHRRQMLKERTAAAAR